MKNKLFFLFILLLIPSVLHLFNSGFFVTDDGEWMIIRFSAFYQALREGQFPVRFLDRLNFGYGYPVPNFLYPGFMYLGVPIHLLGFNFIATIKIIFGASLFLSGIFSYFWLRKIYDELSAFVGGVIYVYAPYHLLDVYRRGSIGEALSLAVLPFILWQVERGSILFISLGLGLLIISHNTLAVLFVSFIIIYMLLKIINSKEKRTKSIEYITSVVIGLGISSFFSVPAVLELQNTVFNSTSVSSWGNYFSDIKMIGIITLLIIVSAAYYIFKDRNNLKNYSLIFIFITGVLSIFFATSFSSFMWNILPVAFIQFPFRFLSLTIVCLAFLSAAVIKFVPSSYKYVAAVFLLIFTFVSAYPYLSSFNKVEKDDAYYATNEATTTVKDEYMPIWVKQKPTSHYSNKVEFQKGNGEIDVISYGSKEISFTVNSSSPSSVIINTVFYPGWEGKINGVNSKIEYNNPRGIMVLNLDKGESGVELRFNETPTRKIADIISLLSLVILVSIAFYTRRNKK